MYRQGILLLNYIRRTALQLYEKLLYEGTETPLLSNRFRRMCFSSYQPVYAVLFLVLSVSRPNVSQAKPLVVNTNNNKLEMFCQDFVCRYFDMLLQLSFEQGLQVRKRLFRLGVSQ
jgi:hypothetical protein